MSDNDNSATKQKWYSVGIRYFAPIMGTPCFICSLTVHANGEKEAVEKAQSMFVKAFYDPLTNKHFLLGGVLIEPWRPTEAVELPPERARLLDQELLKKKTNVIPLFPGQHPPSSPETPDGSEGDDNKP